MAFSSFTLACRKFLFPSQPSNEKNGCFSFQPAPSVASLVTSGTSTSRLGVSQSSVIKSGSMSWDNLRVASTSPLPSSAPTSTTYMQSMCKGTSSAMQSGTLRLDAGTFWGFQCRTHKAGITEIVFGASNPEWSTPRPWGRLAMCSSASHGVAVV